MKQKMIEAIDDSAANIQQFASEIAPMDTGSLRASIYVTNGTDSDYNERVGAAESLNDDVVILEEIDPEFVISPSSSSATGKDSYLVVVGVAAEHGAPQEFGTRFISPQPFLTPATLGEESNFTQAMTKIAS